MPPFVRILSLHSTVIVKLTSNNPGSSGAKGKRGLVGTLVPSEPQDQSGIPGSPKQPGLEAKSDNDGYFIPVVVENLVFGSPDLVGSSGLPDKLGLDDFPGQPSLPD
uniref:Collagen-like protein n=1 Tax=Syphacia muris TaxID=451379 RepID=A0A0N5AAM0_9BILA